MKIIPAINWSALTAATLLLAVAVTAQAQTVTKPVSNRVISWNLDDWSTINPMDLAGLAPATNWVDTYLSDITTSLPDNTGTATTLNLGRGSYNTYHVQANHPGYDANGTANREMLNGFLNAGPAAWNPPVTNTFVALTNIPYAQYDVIVYFNSDTSGRHASIDNGSTTYYFSTVGSPVRSGVNALFLPTTQTNSSVFPSADFAFFPGMTNANAIFTEVPKSGNDQWLGIAAFQVIQSSNVYVPYGPSPANQTISQGQSASFSVMAGGQKPAYQWRHAGTNIVNATNATFAIASTVAGQDGNYDVVVTNSFSSITGTVALLTFYAPKTDTWAGTGSTWDFSSLDWTVNGGVSTTNYADTDNVRFDPLGAGQPVVSLGGTVSPTSITVSNATYLLTSGGISGSGSLHLMNNATFVLDTVDTRTGPTLIDSGSLFELDNGDTAGALGSGPLTNNGALIFNAGGDEAYGYPVYGTGSITNLGSSGQITLGNNINANHLVQAGAGSLLLQGSNSLAGGLVISGGTVLARVGGCLGQGSTLISGGELQLIFSIDFSGASMTLAGGLLHGGIGGNNSYDGTVSLATDSSIQADNNFTLNSVSGLNGGSFNLAKIGAGTLILPGTNNTWGSVTITAGTLQIGAGGPTGSLGGGTIAAGPGTLAFNLAGTLVVTNPITGINAVSQNGAGTTIFTGDNSAFFGTTTVSAGALGGTSTFGGPVSVLPGGTLAPGTAATIGTLTINGDLALGGNLLVKVNKSLTQSNDFVTVSGGLGNTNNGAVIVNNLGPALAVGNKFALFSQPVTGGDALSVSGGGVVWSNRLSVDGSIVVLSITVPRPVITSVQVTAGAANIVFGGTNGLGTYHVLSSTNLSQTSWTVEAAGSFDGSGNFSVTNLITPGNPQKFYRLQLP